jgi:hypothetical protein
MDYEKTLAVLRAAEQVLVGKPQAWPTQPRLLAYADTVLGGPWLVLAGAGILIKRLAWVLVTGITFALVLSLFEDRDNVSVIGPAFILAFGVVYFSMPSRSLAAAVKPENVSSLRDFILASASDGQDLQRLQEGVIIVRTHTLEKLGRFSVLAGIAWGVLFWYAGTHALAPGLSPDAVSRGLSYGLLAALIFIFVLLAGTCHATAVRAVYQTLEFALLEAKATVESTPTAE